MKSYYPKADTMMYVCQLQNPRTGERWVDLVAMEKMLRDRIGKTLIDYAFIVHDQDTVTENDVQDRDNQRLRYLAREYYTALGQDISKQDLQNFAVSEQLHADALKKATEIVDAKLPQFTIGQVKPAHVHVVLRLKENRKTDVVGRWFDGVGQTQPELLKVFKDNQLKSGDRLKNALLYLVHENAPEKFHYDASLVHASFDYCTELSRLIQTAAAHALYKVTPDEVNDFLNMIADGKKARMDFIDEYSYAVYARNSTNIDKAEKHRITHHGIAPKRRIVVYFDSEMEDKARVGKTTGAYEVARRIAIEKYSAPAEKFSTVEAVKTVNPYIFTASSQTLFEGYTGQPIVVLDDFRAGDLKNAFKSRAAIKTFLDPHPGSQRYNIKFDTVLPIPEFVFISGIDQFRDFIESLAGTKARGEEDDNDMVTQFLGRFWARVTFLDATRYCIYKNREFYPAGCAQRFYSTIPFMCSVPAIMRSGLDDDKKAELLKRGFEPAYKEIMSYSSHDQCEQNLDDFFALFGAPATVKYEGFDLIMETYDDKRDAAWSELNADVPEGTYQGSPETRLRLAKQQEEKAREDRVLQASIDAYVASGSTSGIILPIETAEDDEMLPFPETADEISHREGAPSA